MRSLLSSYHSSLPPFRACQALLVLLWIANAGCFSSQRDAEILPAQASPADSISTPAEPSPITRAAWKLPEQIPAREFLASEACRRCHAKSDESWHRTFHRTMTQVASVDSIQAPFDGRKLTRFGITCSVERRGDKFWVTAPDPDIELERHLAGKSAEVASAVPMVEREVVLVTGSHHMQFYWLPSFRGNELRIFPWVFSMDEQRWIPYEDSFVVPPNSRGLRVNWNSNCIACHAVDGKPNFDLDQKHFLTEVVEYGISCEACHGPGQAHVVWQYDWWLVDRYGLCPTWRS